jgi:hypothetical protein
MYQNLKQSRVILLLRRVWPFVYRIINAIFYFIVNLIKYFIANAVKMIKGEY